MPRVLLILSAISAMSAIAVPAIWTPGDSLLEVITFLGDDALIVLIKITTLSGVVGIVASLLHHYRRTSVGGFRAAAAAILVSYSAYICVLAYGFYRNVLAFGFAFQERIIATNTSAIFQIGALGCGIAGLLILGGSWAHRISDQS